VGSNLTLVLGVATMAGLLLVACSKEQKSQTPTHEMSRGHGTPQNWKFTMPAGDPERGRKVFVELECYKCHEVKGETFPQVADKDKGVGPELSQMAGMHPAEYFVESIINPNAVLDPGYKDKGYLGKDGKSKMPDYNDILTVKQIADLVAYLRSLSGGQAAH